MSDDISDSSSQQRLIPPFFYVPVRPRPGSEDFDLDLRLSDNGERVILLYTALDRLISGAGPHQPWAVFKTEDLDRIRAEQKIDKAAIDFVLPEDMRRTADSDTE